MVEIEGETDVQIVCARCSAVLRKVAGLHHAGEPPTSIDEHGRLIRCPHCGSEYREPAAGPDQPYEMLHKTRGSA